MEIQPVTPPRGPARPAAPSAERPAAAKGGVVIDDAARAASRAFEATFITEMLKYTGLNARPGTLGGGAGEEAFASFLNGEYGRLLSERGGIGLAERIFEAITQAKGPR